MAVFETVLELTSVTAAIYPLVLSEAFWLAVVVLANKDITIREEVTAVSVSQAAFPLAFILVAIAPNMHTVSLSLGVLPLANVGLAIRALPNAVATFDASEPFSIVDFTVLPGVDALPVGFSLFIISLVGIGVCEDFVTAPLSLVFPPFTFVDAARLVDKHAKAFSLAADIVELTPVDAVSILFDAESV